MTKPALAAALADYRRDLTGRAQPAREFPPGTRVVAADAVEYVWASHERKWTQALNHWRDVALTAAMDRLGRHVEHEPAPVDDLAGAVRRDAVLFWIDQENPRAK